MKVLITGITGQCAAYLSRDLLAEGHEVYGLARRVARSDPDAQFWRLRDIGIINHKNLHIINGDVTDLGDVTTAICDIRPDEIYHLAAQSDVAMSFNTPFSTFSTNANGTLNILQAVFRNLLDSAKVYIAGSSEQFGAAQPPQSEITEWQPLSPYAVSKCAATLMARYYREAHGMHVSVGILFNNESPLRGLEFVTRKIARAAARISLDMESTLTLGCLTARRDWGYTRDYVRAMCLMLSREEPGDFVIATGISSSVEDFCVLAFKEANITDWKSHLVIDNTLIRPAEVRHLKGDASLANELLGWKPSISLHGLVSKMVRVEVARAKGMKIMPEWL